MKKTQRTKLLGGLASLLLGAGLTFADETKKNDEQPQGGILSKELKAELRKTMQEQGLEAKIQEMIEKALKIEGDKPAAKATITKSFMMGPDGKMKEIDPKDHARFFGMEMDMEMDEAMKKQLKDLGAAFSAKVVVVDENGNLVEKELKPGQDLNGLLKDAIKGADLGEIDLNDIIKEASLLGVGPAMLGHEIAPPGMQALKAEIKELREEQKAQRKLLEKILKKLD
jgi:hypothetical protein